MTDSNLRVLISTERIQARIRELGEQISRGAGDQVRHQGDILTSHCSTSSLNRFDAPKKFLKVFRNTCHLLYF